jgi:late competence protein required for DNA uptake (superfamily II DNA/RNA helicase)
MESKTCYYCGKKQTKQSIFYNLDNKGHKICRSCLQQGYVKSALEIIEHNENVEKRSNYGRRI